MNNKKEVIIFTIVIVALLVITLGGLTFAYFAPNKTISNLNLDVSTANSMYTFVSNTNDNIDININFNEMSEASANNSIPVKSDTANINVSLTNPEEGMMTTCTYDIVWVWDSEDKYIEADVDEFPYTHLATSAVYNYEFSTKVDEDNEMDLSKLDYADNKITLKSGASIMAVGKQTKTINHEITAAIYNLPVDQPNLFNKNFKAHIEIENVDCKMKAAVTINTVCPEGGSLGECIKKLGDSKNIYVGDGELIKHTEDIETSAGDGGYRYSGNKPNNYICFGAGSEEYNSGEADECPDTNLYRIIGLVPVEVSSDNTTNLVKVIKSEYVTSDELGINSVGIWSVPDPYDRIKNNSTHIFHWNDKDQENSKNEWDGSSLYNALNVNDNSFLHFIDYGTGDINKKWSEKIETVLWNVGGVQKSGIPKEVYLQETTERGCYQDDCDNYPIKMGASTKTSGKIGLMYNHDYDFAAPMEVWNLSTANYTNTLNLEHNWLYNGIYEWTITRLAIYSNYSVLIDKEGSANGAAPVYSQANGIRLSFYLKSDVNIITGNNIDGSIGKPFQVS